MQNIVKIEKRDLKAKAEGRWDYVIGRLAPQFAAALIDCEKHLKHHDCPLHGGSKDFRFFRDFLSSGGSVCTCGTFSDGFSLLMAANKWSFQETLGEVHAVLNGQSATLKALPAIKRKEVNYDAENRKRRNLLTAIWTASVLLTDPVAEPALKYLSKRGLNMPQGLSSHLRFHPSLAYYDEDVRLQGHFPAIIARVVDQQGRAVTIHRIFLDNDGNKAPVEDCKKMCPHPHDRPLAGSAIRLFPVKETIAVAEGIETALAVTELTGIPCWSTVVAGLLAQFDPPPGVTQVLVYADKDRSGTGQSAAKTLVERLWSKGIKAGIHLPVLEIADSQKGVDWLDEFLVARA